LYVILVVIGLLADLYVFTTYLKEVVVSYRTA